MFSDIFKERRNEDFDVLYLEQTQWQGVIPDTGIKTILAVQESSEDTQYDIVAESSSAWV